MLPHLPILHGKITRVDIGDLGNEVHHTSDGMLLDGNVHGLNAMKSGVRKVGTIGASNVIVTHKKNIVIVVGMMMPDHQHIRSMHHHPRVIPPELY